MSETQETKVQNMFAAILMPVNLGIGKFLKLYKGIKSKWLIREIIFNGVWDPSPIIVLKKSTKRKKKHCDFIFLDSIEYLNCFVQELRQGEGFMWEFEPEANEKEANKE